MEPGQSISPPSRPSRWFPFYYALIVIGGLGLVALNFSPLSPSVWLLVALWAGLILITDAAPVTLPGGGYITVSSTLDYAGILVLGPIPTALAELIATLFLQLVIQRRPPHKALFNAAAFAGTVVAAGFVYRILGGSTGGNFHFPQVLLPLVGMGFAYYSLNTMIVSLVLALSTGSQTWRIWQVNYLWTIFHMVASLPFGAGLAAAYHGLGVWSVVLFIMPLLLARYSFKLYIEAKRDLLDFASVLVGVIDEFDPYTRRHSQRVSRHAALLARELGLAEREVERVEYAGLLHDIGKIKMSQRELVLKPGPLTSEERELMTHHAGLGADILERVRPFRASSSLVRYHHERIDGNGYHGLPANEIHVGARIILVADAFDAMTTDRIYRKALGVEKAMAELRRCAGTQFDPDVVEALQRLLDRGEIEVAADSAAADATPVARPGLVNAGLN